jgi:hypothetical protein
LPYDKDGGKMKLKMERAVKRWTLKIKIKKNKF